MPASQQIIDGATRAISTTDALGRRLLVRGLTALDTLRLFKAAGPDLAQNEPWLAMASLAFSVTEIDGVPVPTPLTEIHIESLIDRLGNEGLAAIDKVTREDASATEIVHDVGNLRGTPS